jgi:tetratricopeptide (TPR) repeat protein
VADDPIGGQGVGEDGAAQADVVALAAALALDQAQYDPDVARAAADFLKARTAELEAQRAHRLRLRNGTRLVFAAIAGLFAVSGMVMLRDAVTSRAVVVDAFKAPQTLTGRGLTGEVVAEGVRDALQKMQAATRGGDTDPDTRGAWTSDIRIEAPETGVSIGEISRMLHARFGHDLHIRGELIRTDTGGLALTVRNERAPAATFTGGPGDLGKLTVQAAEYVYGRAQPYRYAIYLEGETRNADAVAFLQGAFPLARSDEERAQLASAWGDACSGLFQPGPAVEKHRLAMAFAKPRTKDWWRAWGDLIGVLSVTDEEAAWREGRALLQAAAAAPKREQPDIRWLVNPAQVALDLPLALAFQPDDAKDDAEAGASLISEAPLTAEIYAWLHDPRRAARYTAASDPETRIEVLMLQGYAALDRGDAKGAAAPLETAYEAVLAAPSLQHALGGHLCWTGLAYGLAGRLKEAQAVFEAVFKHEGAPSLCYAFHGEALVRAGDVAGAERVWSDGLDAGPDLPLVRLHRGLFELDRGDLKAAEVDAAAAAAKAPNWADPWKTWGDVLAREGRWQAALDKYDEALKHAPAWAALHQARDTAARHGS